MEQTEHLRQVVRLPDLAVASSTIEAHHFEDCLIIGPAIVVLDNTSVNRCNFNVPEVEAMLWSLDEDRRQFLVGVIRLSNCSFQGCSFTDVGFAGGPDVLNALRGSSPVT